MLCYGYFIGVCPFPSLFKKKKDNNKKKSKTTNLNNKMTKHKLGQPGLWLHAARLETCNTSGNRKPSDAKSVRMMPRLAFFACIRIGMLWLRDEHIQD